MVAPRKTDDKMAKLLKKSKREYERKLINIYTLLSFYSSRKSNLIQDVNIAFQIKLTLTLLKIDQS